MTGVTAVRLVLEFKQSRRELSLFGRGKVREFRGAVSGDYLWRRARP